MRAVIFANAPLPPAGLVNRFLRENDLVVCADGGANRIAGYGIEPDLIIGDLDSVEQSTLDTFGSAEIIRSG